MGIPGTAFPGTALTGQAVPGYPGPPPGVPGKGIIVGTTPVLLASSAAASDMLPSGTCYITNGAAAIYLGGGSNVNPGNGLQVLPTANAPAVPLFPSDQVWACTASGTSTVYAYQTGS
jgi:hypothetical protein